ncbi:unnamed protein product [Leuciscus chuanchicus]
MEATDRTEQGEDTFELHSVQLELETVEKQIRDLLERQAELRDRRSALETSRADAHKSVVSNFLTPTKSSLVSFTPAPTQHHGPWVIPQRKTRARTRARTSPPLQVFEISTRNRFSPLRETGRDAVIIGSSIVRHVHVTSGKGKVSSYRDSSRGRHDSEEGDSHRRHKHKKSKRSKEGKEASEEHSVDQENQEAME